MTLLFKGYAMTRRPSNQPHRLQCFDYAGCRFPSPLASADFALNSKRLSFPGSMNGFRINGIAEREITRLDVTDRCRLHGSVARVSGNPSKLILFDAFAKERKVPIANVVESRINRIAASPLPCRVPVEHSDEFALDC